MLCCAAQGVLRAQHVLSGLALDGQALLLKPNTATQNYLEWVKTHGAAAKPAADRCEDARVVLSQPPSPLLTGASAVKCVQQAPR